MKRLLFFICICFACVLTVQAQNSRYLALHDTVTLRNESKMYLAVDDKGTTIIAHGEPNDNALWEIVGCSYTSSWNTKQSQYQFQHVKTGKYLYVNASKSGNKYTVSLGLSNTTPSQFTGNNPSGENNSYEVPESMYYTFDRKNFTLTYNSTWQLPQNKPTKIYIEKWSAKGNGGLAFKTYFSPETYDFKLVKSTDKDINGNAITDESITQQKKVRFVLDLRDSLYTTCVRSNISDKKLLVSFTEERDLDKLVTEYKIEPTFYWQSTGSTKSNTSTLTLLSGNASQEDFKYFSEDYNKTNTPLETANRKMMEIKGGTISSDKLAWEVTINTYGISPMSLVGKYNDGQSYETKRMVNYTDFLVAEWQFGGKTYTESARIIRKSYHTHDLPQFDISVSPSTFTFNKEGGTQTLNISGYHQHGVAYYDADERIVENVYTYEPVLIPLKSFNVDKDANNTNDLEVTFECKDLDGNPITWLKEKEDSRTDYSIMVEAEPNTAAGAQYRQARVHGTFTLTKDKDGNDHRHQGTIAPIINQRANNDDITFKHVDGIGRNPLEGTERQQVHTVERTIYYTPEQSGGIQLQLAESNFFGYMRWYDYATDGDPTWNASPALPTSWVTVPRGANGTNFKAINTSAGSSFGLYGTHREGQEGPLHRDNADNPAPVLKAWNYTYQANAKEDAEKAASGYHTIACDVSAYTDYQIKRNGNRVLQIDEPTLSYRQLFHLKPAEEMADRLKKVSEIAASEHTPATFLENYKYLAARGVDVHLATNYRYAKYTHQSELCYFYYDSGNKLKRVGKDVQAEWWYTDKNGTRSEVTNPNYQVKDFLNIDSDFEGDVVYELIVPKASTGLDYDLRIARFEITFVLKGACGPSQSTIMTTHEMNEHYQLLEHIDFCFRDNNGNLTATEYTLNGYKQLDYHLPWEQSTYGYYYPTDRIGKEKCWTTTNRIDQGIPYYGEYFLVNKMNKDWAKATAHGGEDDYALYVDGTTEPGRAFSISTQANICAGQTLYCSAWLCNPCPTSHTWNNPRDPIFRCNVEGRVKDINGVWGEWEDVSVFFVGSLAKGSGWQQIVFPVLSDKSYDETRVSIYNFATGGNGNDFMVDDISLFVSRLPLASYQAQTNCSSDANTESSTAVVLRIDYTDFQGERDEYMYYQIFKEKNVYDEEDTAHPIELQYTTNDNSAYFHDNTAYKDETEFGSVLIPTQDFNPETYNTNATENEKVLIFQTVQGFKDYLVDQVKQNLKDNPNGEKSTHAKAYIKTTDSRGQSKWLIYVMHIIPNAKEGEKDENGQLIKVDENKYLRECYNYSLRMANVPEELAAPECNLQTPLHATQATHFDLYNGDKQLVIQGFIPVSLNNCANDYYTLTSVIENVMAITTGGELDKVRGEVLSDWLVGFDFDDVYANTKNHEEQYQEAVRAAEVAFKDKYGYTRAQVKTAILYDLRRDDPDNTNRDKSSFDQLDPLAFADPFNYTVIKHLHDNGWLQLRKSSTSFYLASEEAVRYWVYPIDGTASATYANQTVVLQDCTEPIWVTVTSKHSDHILNIAPVPNADKTDAQKRQLPTVRVLHSTLTDNTKTITIPITDINTNTTQNLVGNDTTKIEFSLSNLDDKIHFVDSTTGKQMKAPTSFEIGKTYMMRMRFADNGGNMHIGGDAANCRVGTVYFRLLVLPDRVIWAPTTGIYDGWGLDGNWIGWNDSGNGTPEGTPDGKIQRNELTEGYVPMAGSEVIIGNVPRAEGVKLPTIDEYEHYPFVHDHNHYPMDVHASPFTCGKIYFAPGAHIHNQHLLQYEQAFVDMLIPSATWNTVSAPLQDMYSGDMFVPHSGWWNNGEKVEELNPFEVYNFQGKRHRDAAYAFSQAFYNQTVEKHYENKGGVNVSASVAFVTSNALSQKLEPAKGFSMRGYGPGNPQTETTLTIRLPKPDTEYAYFSPEGDETSQTTGQLSRANAGRLAFTPTGTGEDPAMAITLTNEVGGDNQSFLFGNPTMALIDMQKLYEDNNNTSWTGTYSYITDNQWGASTQALDDNGRFLPPMTSVMLHTNSNSQSLTINLKPSHLTLSPRDVMSLEKGEPQPVAPRQSSVSDVPYSRPMTMSLYAYTDRASARAILAASPTASDRYQIGEDALFISSGVEMSNVVVTPLNMYTLSEQVPMMVDVRENIDSIPVALLAKDNYRSDSITFAFHLSANWDKECYFYDAVTGERVRIMDGTIIERPAPQNHENRYYIVGPDRTSNGENTETAIPSVQDQENMVWAYSEQAGEMTVCSNDIIQSVTVYDITGRLIAHKALDLLYNQVSLPVGQGVHIAEVTLRDNSKHYTRAIVK